MSSNEQKSAGVSESSCSLMWEEVHTDHIVKDEWIDFRRSSYRLPDGSVSEPYYSFSRRDYVVIVASDEEGKYLCLRQFRHGIREVTTEFPAGGIERTDGKEYGDSREMYAEDPLVTAKRELLEETGYESDQWTHLITVPSNATVSDNYAHVYLARNCRLVSEQELDETEFLGVVRLSASELEKLIAEGRFQQSVHIMAWLFAQRMETKYDTPQGVSKSRIYSESDCREEKKHGSGD